MTLIFSTAAAFAANAVDDSVTGDGEDVQVHLGLLEARLTPKPRYDPVRFDQPTAELPALPARANRERRAADKRRRKMRNSRGGTGGAGKLVAASETR